MDAESLETMADDLSIASDYYKWLAALLRAGKLKGATRRKAAALLRRGEGLVIDLIYLHDSDPSLPKWHAGKGELCS